MSLAVVGYAALAALLALPGWRWVRAGGHRRESDTDAGDVPQARWLLPVAAIYLFGIADSATSHMGSNPWSLNLMLMAAGVVTTIPLLCFTGAATRLRLSTLGFFQYIGPTLMFLLAVTFYGEKPGADKMVTFAFIWVALAIFVMDAIYTQRRTSK